MTKTDQTPETIADADLDAAAGAGPAGTGKTLSAPLLGKYINGSSHGMQEEIEMVIERLERG